jgi:hemoglobin
LPSSSVFKPCTRTDLRTSSGGVTLAFWPGLGHTFRVEKTLFELLGEPRLRAIVDTFYDHMDRRPESQPIRAMHPADLSSSRDKLFWFLVGWSGGPDLYVQRFGHPRLRARHLPFVIGDAEAVQWMDCMRLALEAHVPEPHLRSLLESALGRIANHMRNAEP